MNIFELVVTIIFIIGLMIGIVGIPYRMNKANKSDSQVDRVNSIEGLKKGVLILISFVLLCILFISVIVPKLF